MRSTRELIQKLRTMFSMPAAVLTSAGRTGRSLAFRQLAPRRRRDFPPRTRAARWFAMPWCRRSPAALAENSSIIANRHARISWLLLAAVLTS